MNRDDCGGDRSRHLELAGINDAHFSASRALRNRLLRHTKCEVLRRWSQRARGNSLVFAQWTGHGGLKNELLPARHFFDRLRAYPEIGGQHVMRRVRHPIGEQHRLVFREVAVVENQQKFGAVGIQTLNRMRNSGWEVPEIALGHVGNEALAVQINRGDAGISVKHQSPLSSGMPVQLANAAGRQPHVDARH